MTYPRTFSHIGLSVTDLEKAVDFYTKILGWYVIMRPTEIVLQVCANNADSVKSASPKGGKHFSYVWNARFRYQNKILQIPVYLVLSMDLSNNLNGM